MGKINLAENVVRQIVKNVLRAVKPDKIVVFNSSVGEDNTNSSDVDIVLFGVKGEKYFLVKDKLKEGLPALKDMNLILFDTLKTGKLKKRILIEGVVIYKKSPKR